MNTAQGILCRGNLKRRLSLTAALCLACNSIGFAAAPNDVMTLKIHLKDGSSATYELGADAKITFENANMCYSSRDYKFDIPLSDISLWSYDARPAYLGEIPSDGIIITQKGDIISLSGLEKGVDIKVYSIDGKLIYSDRSSSGQINIPAEGWNKGVYIINAGNSTFKIMKK